MEVSKKGRRQFLKMLSVAGAGISLSGFNPLQDQGKAQVTRKAGIIGLDTSHAVAFVKALNTQNPNPDFNGYRIVAAYPKGSNDIQSSIDRIPGYTEEVKKFGVQIVNSIEELITLVDVVFLETNDGRLHLKQALPVIKAKKTLFIDKPIAASYKDTKAIFDAAAKYQTPVFSSSSLRYITGMGDVKEGKIGKVLGADTYSPASLEKTHPDLFWYGIHGVETLFAAMGTGCSIVRRVNTNDTDVVVGIWNDGRIGTFRGTRSGKGGYGGTVFGERANTTLGPFKGYDPLLLEIIKFFDTGKPPVTAAETLEIVAFMEAAEKSKQRGGSAVSISEITGKNK